MRAAVTTLLSLVALTRFGHSADSDGGQCESGAGKATSRDDRIPGWKTAMFEGANNGSLHLVVDTMKAGAEHSRLVAFQGCRIVTLLAQLEGGAKRDDLCVLGAIPAVTSAMGAHKPSAKVQAMGCAAMQALADGNANHTEATVRSGGAEVVGWVMAHLGPYNDRVAEYCIAATASLSMDATGAARLGNAGAVESVVETMRAHIGKGKVDIQLFGCAALQRLAENCEANVKRLAGHPHAISAVVDALKKFGDHPTLLSVCGGLLQGPQKHRYLPG